MTNTASHDLANATEITIGVTPDGEHYADLNRDLADPDWDGPLHTVDLAAGEFDAIRNDSHATLTVLARRFGFPEGTTLVHADDLAADRSTEYVASYGIERPTIVVTTDMEYDLSQVVDLPDDDDARQAVIDHYSTVWGAAVKAEAAKRGYDADTYAGPDQSVADSRRTHTPYGGSYSDLEEELFQVGHDSFGVDQDDVDGISAEHGA